MQKDDEKNESLFWLLIQAGGHVRCPWNKNIRHDVCPTRILGFDTWPGHGCEAANFGFCSYPETIDREYKPEDDARFQAKSQDLGWPHFSWEKWSRHCRRVTGVLRLPSEARETRQVATGLTGWSWSSFCKTQYASNPDCGGPANFLRCHISVITLLERMAKLPGLKVHISDEGKYGPSTYSDDYHEAAEAGRKPTYRRHPGRHNPADLVREVGDWNTMIGGLAEALSDALAGSGMKLESAIHAFPNFEQLEFRGRRQRDLDPFLQVLKQAAETVRNQAAIGREPPSQGA